MLFQQICTRIVPEGYSGMEQGKATRELALRINGLVAHWRIYISIDCLQGSTSV